MRTNRLRRWLLRGVLISSAALASAGVSQSAQAQDVTWNNAPHAESVQPAEPPVDPELRIENDITWN